jgi:undecaprenyl-phosphate 4-deoxy-4-formamido-L-arabinose transferase
VNCWHRRARERRWCIFVATARETARAHRETEKQEDALMPNPLLSVVIPVYNEEDTLQALFDRLYPALDGLRLPYEIVFINDGSRDRSAALLRAQYQRRPEVTRVVLFSGNYGQHMAIMAGFERCRGERIVTLDADLQNPPEEIGKLLEEMDKGHDYVGSIRGKREDSWWRHLASRAMNRLRERITHIKMTDQGCMLRAYSREIIEAITASREASTYIPALAYTFAHNPGEVVVEHEERVAGTSKYSLYSLIRLNFDLVTGFSLMPLQLFSLVGMLLALGSGAFVVLLTVRRLIVGPEAEGLFTLFAILFFLIGIALFGIGLLGEYVGRIYQQVRERPRYIVQAVLEQPHPLAEGIPVPEAREELG